MIGWYYPFDVWGPSPKRGNGSDNRNFQLTTIRYTINYAPTGGWPYGSGDGNCGSTGVCSDGGTNIPLNSAHNGGVNALMGDGSVRFLQDSTPLATLAALATRDDGLVLQAD
jgi:prepilin-type processing-associated H-X9-DG protein